MQLGAAEIWDSVVQSFINVYSLDFGRIYFESPETSFAVIGVVILSLIAWSLAAYFGEQKYHRRHSGSKFYRQYSWSWVCKFGYVLPVWTLVIPFVMFLLVLAGPYTHDVHEQKVVTVSRVMIFVKDVSTSMWELFRNSEIASAKMADDKFLDFLRMRLGKGDRKSFWLFASLPHFRQRFVVNDELFYLNASSAPYIIYSGNYKDVSGSKIIPEERYMKVERDGGGTNLTGLLSVLLEYVKEDPYCMNPAFNKAIIFITDAELDSFPETALKELQRLNFRPYIIWINNTNKNYETTAGYIPSFVGKIGEFGGKYFDVVSADALKEAFKEIDKLEPISVTELKFSGKKELFFDFLIVGLAFLFLLTVLNLLVKCRKSLFP